MANPPALLMTVPLTLAASTRENSLTQEGAETSVERHAHTPTAVHYIQGVAPVPAGFEVVKSVEFGPGEVTFISAAGHRGTAPPRHEFLKTAVL